MIRLSHAVCGLLLSSLVACGGGGGGSAPAPASVSLDTSSVVLVSTPAQPLPAANVAVTFNRAGVVAGMPVGTDKPAWLDITTAGGTTSPVTVVVAANAFATPQLAQGQYSTVVRFVTGNVDGSDLATKDLPVTLVIAHRVAPAQSQLVIVQGQDPSAASTTLALTANGVNWTARSDSAWLGLDQASGSGSANLTAHLLDSTLAPGAHTALVTVTDVDHHIDVVATVRLQVDPRALVVRNPGVALTSIANRQVLSAALPVTDTAGLPSTWTATADQSWLTVDTPAGPAGSSLALHADPTGLADGMHYATLTVTPTTAGVAGSGRVRVGLYIDRSLTAPASAFAPRRDPVTASAGYGVLVADPVRPYVYLSAGDDEIDVYNVYSGALVRGITLPGAGFASMAMAPDGAVLLAADQAGGRLFPIDPDSLTIGSAVPGAIVTPDFNFRMTAGEVGGRLVVATSQFRLFDATTGVLLSDFSGTVTLDPFFMGLPIMSHDGRSLAMQETGLEPHTLIRFAIANDGSYNGLLLKSATEPGFGFGYGGVFLADDSLLVTQSNDGDAVYSGLGVRSVIGGTTSPIDRGLATRRDGGFYDRAYDGNGNTVIEAFDRSAQPLAAVLTLSPGGAVGELQVSGDQQRLVMVGSSLGFTALP